ncbi:MAG: N-acetylmuramoyl-L-alanine amidase [Candidatus Eremiobacteraeota bacterium]|nr:N-acetylmuramoyl-L-alanine amidase [Candidatus Eremiobacteraeota bacterium]
MSNIPSFRATPPPGQEPELPLKGKKICLDAGHGGKDGGAHGPAGTDEKDMNLAVSLKTKADLEKCGAEVILTRGDDTFISLHDRTEIAEKEGCDIFVSTHFNSAAKKKRLAEGTETFWYTKGDSEDKKLATELQTNLVQTIGLKDRGVKQAGFQVLREADMPAALIEPAFISNPSEEALVVDSAFQEKIALAVTKGILGFFGCPVPPSLNPGPDPGPGPGPGPGQ